MLSELNQLTLKADGRYVTPEEWQPVHTYLAEMRQRFSAYGKIKAAEAEILQEMERRFLMRYPNFVYKNKPDMAKICRRDYIDMLRYIAATLLTGDITAYKQRTLCWFQTIAHCFHQESGSQFYGIMGEVLKERLTPQEFALVRPIVDITAEMVGS
ncbi:phycobilisome protein [Synechococcus sp. C9]|jgi:hypothetical protein|uniref:phycobilisome protein n=1 Tax=Synechococcus sp. C9 TaxID=102119 RepID=UPI001FF28EC4|nr:phycobilisome protein [Synechococcus sp. C9]